MTLTSFFIVKNASEKIMSIHEGNKDIEKGSEKNMPKESDNSISKQIDEVFKPIAEEKSSDLTREFHAQFEKFDKERKHSSYTVKKNRILLEVKSKIV